jgi:hypothetical protein
VIGPAAVSAELCRRRARVTFWLNPDDPDERSLFEAILDDTAPNTPYFGWFPADVAGEFQGVELASARGTTLAADSANLTVFASMPGCAHANRRQFHASGATWRTRSP